MEIKILCPVWGHELMAQVTFLNKIKDAGFDGVEAWVPGTRALKQELMAYVEDHGLALVIHQHEASGSTFKEFEHSFQANLYQCAEMKPVLINSHTGRDFFTRDQNLRLLEIADAFSAETGLVVAHETHRGRIGYGPAAMREYFAANKDFSLTADFSHWTCVSESMLENFELELNEAIHRTRHVHARIGYTQGPQVPDPFSPHWKFIVDRFLSWWDRIVALNRKNNRSLLTFTTEFGPEPYMEHFSYQGDMIRHQFELNCLMKDLLRSRYVDTNHY